VLPFV